MRRQVIDSLVGFGGWMPGVELGMGVVARPVRHRLAGRPGPGPGHRRRRRRPSSTRSRSRCSACDPRSARARSRSRPPRWRSASSAIEGDASSAGTGHGRARRRLGHVQHRPSAGGDRHERLGAEPARRARSIDGPPGSGRIRRQFWPPGITLEVRNPTTGEWTLVGDISERSSFEIDDPIDGDQPDRPDRGAHHRHRGVNPNFGQASVFVSAEARGVIGE